MVIIAIAPGTSFGKHRESNERLVTFLATGSRWTRSPLSFFDGSDLSNPDPLNDDLLNSRLPKVAAEHREESADVFNAESASQKSQLHVTTRRYLQPWNDRFAAYDRRPH